MTTTPEALRLAREALAGYPYDDAHWRDKCAPAIAAIDALPADPVPAWEPVATLWQHCETGRTRVTMPDQVWTQDATWDIVGPLYLHPAQGAANSILDGSTAEPVATLHDDGCFTWKRDEFRLKYDRQRAGWRMDVYAHPAPAVAAPEPVAQAEIERLLGQFAMACAFGYNTETRRAAGEAILSAFAAAHPAPAVAATVRGLTKQQIDDVAFDRGTQAADTYSAVHDFANAIQRACAAAWGVTIATPAAPKDQQP